MDRKEKQWNMIVDIIGTIRSLLAERKRLFEDLYVDHVLN